MKTVEAEDTPVRENCNDTKTGMCPNWVSGMRRKACTDA
jgi:hypothetical protein